MIIKIEKILRNWVKESGTIYSVLYTYSHGKLEIFTHSPMYLIGEDGNLYKKYEKYLQFEVKGLYDIFITEAKEL